MIRISEPWTSFGLALALLMAAPAGCGGGDEAQDRAATFTDPAGYSLEVPQGWSLSDRTGGDGLIRADVTRGEGMGVQVRLVSPPPGNFRSATSSMLRDYVSDMSGHWGGGMEETERITPDVGDRALTVRFRATRDDGSVWFLQESFVQSGGRMVVLQGGCPREDMETALPAFDRMVESISFD
jgi:hypothetical protein